MKFLALLGALLVSVVSAGANACDDFGTAVDTFISSIRDSGKKLDEATNAHDFASALNLFSDATEAFTKRVKELGPDLVKLSASDPDTPPAGCDKAQERLTSFESDLNSIGAKLGSEGQKYIKDSEVKQAFERLKNLQIKEN
jgi:hypothetical protein